MKPIVFVPLFIFLALVVLFFVGLGLNPRELPSPLIGKPAPQFSLPEVLDPQKTVSRDDLLGKVSLVNAWASWCVSCRSEHHFLMTLSSEYGIPIYGINFKDERKDALGYLSKLGNPYTASGHDIEGTVGIDFGVIATPETFLVDKKGIIRYKQTGPLDAQVWQEKIAPLVAQLQAENR